MTDPAPRLALVAHVRELIELGQLVTPARLRYALGCFERAEETKRHAPEEDPRGRPAAESEHDRRQ